jgi:hypothetical protein
MIFNLFFSKSLEYIKNIENSDIIKIQRFTGLLWFIRLWLGTVSWGFILLKLGIILRNRLPS